MEVLMPLSLIWNQLTDLNAIHKLLNDKVEIKVGKKNPVAKEVHVKSKKMGALGGRNFLVVDSNEKTVTTFKMKDLLTRLLQAAEEEAKKPVKDLSKLDPIVKKIMALDTEATTPLNKGPKQVNFIKRILTSIRQKLGNRRFNKGDTLKKIREIIDRESKKTDAATQKTAEDKTNHETTKNRDKTTNTSVIGKSQTAEQEEDSGDINLEESKNKQNPHEKDTADSAKAPETPHNQASPQDLPSGPRLPVITLRKSRSRSLSGGPPTKPLNAETQASTNDPSSIARGHGRPRSGSWPGEASSALFSDTSDPIIDLNLIAQRTQSLGHPNINQPSNKIEDNPTNLANTATEKKQRSLAIDLKEKLDTVKLPENVRKPASKKQIKKEIDHYKSELSKYLTDKESKDTLNKVLKARRLYNNPNVSFATERRMAGFDKKVNILNTNYQLKLPNDKNKKIQFLTNFLKMMLNFTLDPTAALQKWEQSEENKDNYLVPNIKK